jgi:uncharacterized protein YoxC
MLMTLTSTTIFSAFEQTSPAITSADNKLLIILALVAGAMVVQAIVFVVLAIVGVKTQKKLLITVEEVKALAFPIMQKSSGLMTDLTPQIKDISLKVNAITGHVQHISAVVKDKVEELSPVVSTAVTSAQATFLEANDTARDANEKTRAQVQRVNGMISVALDATAKMAASVHETLQVPVREFAGVVNGIKAGLDVFLRAGRGISRGTPQSYEAHEVPRPGVPVSLSRTDADAALLQERREAGF